MKADVSQGRYDLQGDVPASEGEYCTERRYDGKYIVGAYRDDCALQWSRCVDAAGG